MFQLHILSGKMAGTVCVARHLPFRVGRNADADLVAAEPGVWDNHLEFIHLPGKGIEVSAHADAQMVVNGDRVPAMVLRNGDVIEVGGLRQRFWLSDVTPASHTVRECITWVGLILLFLGQIATIYWLLK